MKTFLVRTLDRWRDWLADHHASDPEVWLIFHKRHTDVTSIDYKDARDEALCFGWVDSLVKRLDERRYAGQVHTAAPGQPMVRGESEALRRTQCRMAIETARNCLHAFRRTSRRRCGIIQKPCATSKRCRLRSSGGILHGSSPPSEDTKIRRLEEAIRLLAGGKVLGLK